MTAASKVFQDGCQGQSLCYSTFPMKHLLAGGELGAVVSALFNLIAHLDLALLFAGITLNPPTEASPLISTAMNINQILKAIGFFLLEVIGIPGNLVILICFVDLWIFRSSALPTEIILCKLSFVNLVVVLIRVIPLSLATVGFKQLFNEGGCNFYVTAYRICKGMSVCLTSLLSCYQCAVLAQRSKFWTAIKEIVAKNLLPLISTLWGFNTILDVVSVNSFLFGTQQNVTAHVVNLGFCFIRLPSYSVFLAHGALSVARDLLFVTLMALSSLYIVIILYRHHQQVKSIRRSERDKKKAAETKAANIVLVLVSMYVVFFGLDCSIWIFSIFASAYVPTELIEARTFFASSYCALSPVVIVATNKKLHMKLKSMFQR